ncbi:hypothetical protein AADZ90_009405 [Aestuariibius sp. 2305UL40-4]|uniref:hypothetical protein n=1 Tax=Aestuariibius violaceus TaxID=3234132 RepID=UPI00345EFE67
MAEMLVQTFLLMLGTVYTAGVLSIAAFWGVGEMVTAGVSCLLLFVAAARIGDFPVLARRSRAIDHSRQS